MTLASIFLLLAARVVAGIVNAIAGGGILFVLPAMELVGLGPAPASAC